MLQAPIRSLPALLAALALLPACAGTRTRTSAEHFNELIDHRRYEEAVREAARLAEDRPDDAEAQDLHRLVSMAWLLEQGRRLTFKDRDEEALAVFRQAADLEPDNQVVRTWIDKTQRKLADTWLTRGLEAHAEGEIDKAIEAYSKALEYQPGDISALNGMAQAVILTNYRKGLSETYYKEGMHALSDYWLQQARARFAYSEKYDPGAERTERRLQHVDRLLADERVVVAQRLEEETLYGAARNEYRLAAALDPDNQTAQDGFQRMDTEAKATAKLEEARMMILRRDFPQAESLIEEGQTLTAKQQALFEGARIDIEEAHLEDMYSEAIALEKDYRYPEAIEAYTRIIDRAQFYKDVLTRRSTLEGYIQKAQELYDEAQQTSGEQKLQLLQEIEVFWPDYKDVPQQIGQLQSDT
jgi:tetratricopeptide (TPR) repeat protein